MKNIANNKKASYDYEILNKYEAGIVLLGSEVKSIKEYRVNLKDSFIYIDKNNEIWWKQGHISNLSTTNIHFQHEELRNRKLLLNKKEILKLKKETELKGYTIIPLKIYVNEQNKIKLLIGLAKGKKNYDKRKSLKEKDLKREQERRLF